MTQEEAKLVLDSLSTWVGQERLVTEEIVEAIRTLSKPSLPSNLDEAAGVIVAQLVPTLGQKNEDGSYVKGTRDYFSRDELISLVESGAEWMDGQGDVIATRLVIDSEGKVNLNFAIGDITDENCRPKYYAGQDVIVQIRKK